MQLTRTLGVSINLKGFTRIALPPFQETVERHIPPLSLFRRSFAASPDVSVTEKLLNAVPLQAGIVCFRSTPTPQCGSLSPPRPPHGLHSLRGEICVHSVFAVKAVHRYIVFRWGYISRSAK